MIFLIALTTGLFSSLHCIGMCGPLALALPTGRFSKRKAIFAKLLYNFGRISTYSFLGLIFGFIGEKIALFQFQQTFSIILGITFLIFIFKHKLLTFNQLGFINQFLRTKFKQFFNSNQLQNFYFIGIINGFLPCAMIYLALTGAVVSASPIEGMIYMAIFGLGTSPAMFLLVHFAGILKNKNSIILRKTTSIYSLLFAVLLIVRGLNLGIPYLSPQVIENQTSTITVCHGK
jgi:uncharacterized protein